MGHSVLLHLRDRPKELLEKFLLEEAMLKRNILDTVVTGLEGIFNSFFSLPSMGVSC
jgi:hypothetical protein